MAKLSDALSIRNPTSDLRVRRLTPLVSPRPTNILDCRLDLRLLIWLLILESTGTLALARSPSELCPGGETWGTGGMVPPKFEVGDGPCIRPPQYFGFRKKVIRHFGWRNRNVGLKKGHYKCPQCFCLFPLFHTLLPEALTTLLGYFKQIEI